MRRRNLVLVVLATAIVSASLAWFAGRQIRSPAEVAARTAAPKATPILVPVSRRVLATRVVTRGTAHYGSPQKLSVTGSRLKSGPRVVTTLPRDGSDIGSGQVLMTISGRPVFLMQGAQPGYRDLGPGITGPDVRQLERSLRTAGLRPGPVDGVYDTATEAAVARLYHRHGFEPLVATESLLGRARPRQATVVAGARASAGVQVPADEVVFVPSAPLRVTEHLAGLGARVRGPLVTVTDSHVVVDALVPVEQASLLRTGQRVVVDEPTLGIDTRGTVASVAARPGTDGADGFHVFVQVAVGRPPAALVGASVRLTIPVRSTKTARLTVPVSAVSLGPDGGSRVERATDPSGNRTRAVPVRTGLSADGFVAVSAASGSLSAGDLVLVGFRKE